MAWESHEKVRRDACLQQTITVNGKLKMEWNSEMPCEDDIEKRSTCFSEMDSSEDDVYPDNNPDSEDEMLSSEDVSVEFDQNNAEKTEKTQMLSAMKYKSFFCCVLLCLGTISVETVFSLQDNFSSLTTSERSQWILDWLWSHYSYHDGDLTFKFIIGTSSVCLTAWLAVLGVPSSTFYSIRARFKNNEKVMPVKGKQSGSFSTEAWNCITWLEEYARLYAEKHPDSCHLDLPPCLTKKSVYEIMSEELHDQGVKVVTENYFISILWRKYCSHIKIPAASRFSKCDVCIKLKMEIAETKSKETRKRLFHQRRQHLDKQSQERRKYYKHCAKSRKEPNKYMSIIIDGMDQQKTFIPNFMHMSKFMSGMWRLRTHLVGTIVHGVGVYGFFDQFQWPHSTNLTLTILVHVFFLLKDSIPDILYLQMDNCARENKNRYVLAFFTWLVDIGLFKKVKISFLMVGHTHEDIDQVFSRFSVWLSKFSTLTMDQLLKAFESCYNPHPLSVQLDHVFNFTNWLEKHIEKIEGHSKPHCYKISKDQDGKTKLYFKNWSTDKDWTDATAENALLKTSPMDTPSLVKPTLDLVDLGKVEDSIKKCIDKRFLTNEDDIAWWRQFLAKSKANDDNQTVDWPLPEILLSKEIRRLGEIRSEVQEFQDIVEIPVEVTIGKKKRKK
ncbi:uncharacterized protein [Mytilus edulis]|uniref:uncharacterized protein n=1 Tax=Mytilus edulis TaxID=6550 RepID=UPI0039EF6A15